MSSPDLDSRIQEAFERYESTVALVSTLVASRQYSQEIILLTCARLDSLANLALAGRSSQKETFAKFILQHGGGRFGLAHVSVPDLFDHFAVQLWLLPGVVEVPGRIHIFDPREDELYANFLWDSGVAITTEEIQRLLTFVMRTLKSRYRVTPTQTRKKPTVETSDKLLGFLREAAKAHRRGIYGRAMEALPPLIRDHRLATLLYKRFRSGVIHEYRVGIDEERFYSRREIYWRTVYREFVPPFKFLESQFPAGVLASILQNCIRGYRAQLRVTQQLPASLFNELYKSPEEIERLDQRSLPEGRDLRPAVRARQD